MTKHLETPHTEETLFVLDSSDIANQYEDLVKRAQEVALRYARWAVADYSAKHPQRKVTLCAAMGTCTLHVQQKQVWNKGCDLQLSAGEDGAPAFLARLQTLGQALNIYQTYDDWFGSVRICAFGGQLTDEATNW